MKNFLSLLLAFLLIISFAGIFGSAHAAFPLENPCAPATASVDCKDPGGKIYSCQGDDPATLAKEGICKGPCTADNQCGVGTGFVNNLGWENGRCTTGNTGNKGSCIEAVAAGSELGPGPQTGGELKTVFESIIDWIFVFFLIIATIFIILAGLQFLTGGGDASKVTEARQKLLYAVVAVVVASFAKGVPVVIKSIVGA